MKESSRVQKIKVLMYHRVVAEKPEVECRWHYVTVSEFRKQMDMIDRLGYTPITFADYQLYVEGKLSLPSKPIIITFDDGYLDTIENAIPVLLEFNMRAVIFVMGNRELKSARWDEQGDFDICPLMSDDQIRTAQRMGFEIGAHSLDHSALTGLTDREIMYEVEKSKEVIENVLDKPVQTFSYPYGSVDERVKRIVSKSGFLFACGVYSGSAKFSQSLMDFRRIAVNQNTSSLKFLLTILFPYQYVEWMYFKAKNVIINDLTKDSNNPINNSSKNGTNESGKFDIQNIFNSNSL